MSTAEQTYIVNEVVGTWRERIDAAIRTGLLRAGKTLRRIDWFEVREIRGSVEGLQVGWFQVKMGVGMRLEEPED